MNNGEEHYDDICGVVRRKGIDFSHKGHKEHKEFSVLTMSFVIPQMRFLFSPTIALAPERRAVFQHGV